MSNFFKIVFKNLKIREAIRSELEQDLIFIVGYLPGIVGYVGRYLAYKFFFQKIKGLPFIFPNVRFIHMNKISLGSNVLINANTYIYGRGGVDIGNYVLISPGCSIVAGDHNFKKEMPILMQECKQDKIVIEDDVWLGANVVVAGGVTIGKGAVVGAGSVVVNNLEPYSINVGIPAKKIKDRV